MKVGIFNKIYSNEIKNKQTTNSRIQPKPESSKLRTKIFSVTVNSVSRKYRNAVSFAISEGNKITSFS